MPMIYTHESTPEVYNTSRDFQLLGNIYNCIVNGIKFDVDSIRHIVDTSTCNNKVLSLLQTKLGFFTDMDVSDSSLRHILKAFPDAVRWKGSKRGVEYAVRSFLKSLHIQSPINVEVINDGDIINPYTVYIGLDMNFTDTRLLDEVLKYILPTGYTVRYIFYNRFDVGDMYIDAKIGANIVILTDSVNSIHRGNYIAYKNEVEDRLIGSVGLTKVALPYDTDYINQINFVPHNEIGLERDIGKLFDLPYQDKIVYLWDSVKNKRIPITFINDVAILYDSDNLIVRVDDIAESREKSISYVCARVFGKDNVGDMVETIRKYVRLNSSYSYTVFESAHYGYYRNGEFYNNKVSELNKVVPATKSGIKIAFSDNQNISAMRVLDGTYVLNNNNIRYNLHDESTNRIWQYTNGQWVNADYSENGIEIQGKPLEAYIIAKPKMVVKNEHSNEIWKSITADNTIVWSKTSLDIEEDIEKVVYIDSGSPTNAVLSTIQSGGITSCYNSDEHISWNLEDNQWVSGMHDNTIDIIGDPHNAYIVPKKYSFLLEDGTLLQEQPVSAYSVDEDGILKESWEYDVSNEYIDKVIISPENIGTSYDERELYIDKDSSNGYKCEPIIFLETSDENVIISDKEMYITKYTETFDSCRMRMKNATFIKNGDLWSVDDKAVDLLEWGISLKSNNVQSFMVGVDINKRIERVMFFNRADNVYETSRREFNEMVSDGLITPAFRDKDDPLVGNTEAIFQDFYGNMFLL